MADRTTAKEVSIDLAGFKSSVDKQFSLLTKAVFGFYALMVAVIGGGFLLHRDLSDIKAQISKSDEGITGLRRNLTSVQGRMGVLEKNTSDIVTTQKDIAVVQRQILAAQGQIVASLGRIDSRLGSPLAVQPLALSPGEEQSIRDFFGIPKGLAKTPKYGIGDVIQNSAPVPDDLAAKVPRLKGFTYAKDPDNGSVLIVDITGHVVAVVGPA
jgi:hypothetical protein